MAATGATQAKKESNDPRRGSRQRLLNATIDHVREHGMGDITLRQLAVALGTSHRMLIFHFGSKEGLLVEVVRAVEARQKQALDELGADPGLSAADQLRRLWARLVQPELAQHERLFFEAYAYALQNRPHTHALLEHLVDDWLTPLHDFGLKLGIPEAAARAEGRLILATVRGLILDLLATGDRDGVQAAFDRFVARYDRPAA